MTPASIVITGATGFAGRHLRERLPSGAHVHAWGRRDVDLLDRNAVDRAVESARPSAIFHLAGATHVAASFADPALALRVNGLGTHHLLEAVRKHAPRARVIVTTSAMIYEPGVEARTEETRLAPQSPYGLSKLAQDRLAMEAARDGLDVVVARPFNHTGARQHPSFAIPGFAKQIAEIEAGLAPPVIRVGNLDAERDITDVRDVVDAYVLLSERGEAGLAYNVCSGKALQIGRFLERLVGLSGVKVDVEVDPARVRPAELSRLAGDNSRMRAAGWMPRIDLETMLRDLLDYWRGRTRA